MTPQRGPAGAIIVLGSLAFTGLGIWFSIKDMNERKCVVSPAAAQASLLALYSIIHII
jgi:hypothetical protein